MPSSSNGTNIVLVARREYVERVRSRAFVFSTLLLVGLAVVVALIPLGVRLLDKATVTRVGVVADAGLAPAPSDMDAALNANAEGDTGVRRFDFEPRTMPGRPRTTCATASVAGAVLIVRKPDNGLDFRVVTTGALSPDRARAPDRRVRRRDPRLDGIPRRRPIRSPVPRSRRDAGASASGDGTGLTIDTAEYASRRIVGIVFVVLSFLTLVFYGLWVASGVVAEKASRVMELLISPRPRAQLVVGKIGGIGLAGLTQVPWSCCRRWSRCCVRAARPVMFGIADAAPSLGGLSPGLSRRSLSTSRSGSRSMPRCTRARGPC